LGFQARFGRVFDANRTDVADARLEQGADLLARGRPETAEQTFRQVLLSFPDSAVVHSLLAMALADQNRSHDALRASDEAVHLNPQLALAHAARACALETLGMAWEAEMEGRQAVALAPTDPNRHSDLAGIVGRAGRFSEALDITGRGLSLNPQHLPSLHCRALALVSLGRTDEAQEVLTSALLEDPDLAQLHASIGTALENEGEFERAGDEYREAIRLDNSVMTAHEGLKRLKSRNRHLLPVRWLRKTRRQATDATDAAPDSTNAGAE
jgi:tetratricopeptide (TPR) repeat protein